MNKEKIEQEASEQAHAFLDWMEKSYGFIPYGFYRNVKKMLLIFAENIDPELTTATEETK